ncbi:hypothetical protein ACNKHO_14520 [Shigella flexneri]
MLREGGIHTPALREIESSMRCWCWVKTSQTGARVALAVRQAVKGKAREMAAARKWLTGRLRQSSTSASARSTAVCDQR